MMTQRLIVLLVCLSFSAQAFPQIYRWKDKDGNTVVSTTPPPRGVASAKKEVARAQPAPRTNDAESAKPAAPDSEFKRPYKDVRVLMYGTEWCPYCHKARAFLQGLGVNLVEYDVEKDAQRDNERLRKTAGRTGVPVIDIDGVIIIGFDAGKIRATIEEKRAL